MKKAQKNTIQNGNAKFNALWIAVVVLFLMNITTTAYFLFLCKKSDETFGRAITLITLNNLMIKNNYKCNVEHDKEACDSHKELSERYRRIVNPENN